MKPGIRLDALGILAHQTVSICKGEISRGKTRIHLNRFFELGQAFIVMPGENQNLTVEAVDYRGKRFKLQGAMKFGHAFRRPAGASQHDAKIVMSSSVIRIEFDRSSV